MTITSNGYTTTYQFDAGYQQAEFCDVLRNAGIGFDKNTYFRVIVLDNFRVAKRIYERSLSS